MKQWDIDILIAVLAGAAQFCSAYLGWRVTVRPLRPNEERRKRVYTSIFWLSGCVGLIAVGVGTFRSSQAVDSLSEALRIRGIVPVRAALRSPTYSLKVDPGMHAAVGQTFQNVGTEAARDIRVYTRIALVDSSHALRNVTIKELWDKKEEVSEVEKTVPPNNSLSLNLEGPVVSARELEKLRTGNDVLIIMGYVTYQDSEGPGHVHYCRLVRNGLHPENPADWTRCSVPGFGS